MEKLEEMVIVEHINNLSRLFGGFLTTRSKKMDFSSEKNPNPRDLAIDAYLKWLKDIEDSIITKDLAKLESTRAKISKEISGAMYRWDANPGIIDLLELSIDSFAYLSKHPKDDSFREELLIECKKLNPEQD